LSSWRLANATMALVSTRTGARRRVDDLWRGLTAASGTRRGNGHGSPRGPSARRRRLQRRRYRSDRQIAAQGGAVWA
jgi:hypothetical protein